MAAVRRLLTFVDVDDAADLDARTMSVTARHDAVLDDGRRVVLLDDRGWTSGGGPPDAGGPWAFETAEGMERTARTVVGPDGPFGARSQADMEADHWAALARVLRGYGIEVAAADLKALPHDVELSARVRACLGAGRPR
jgi:hypothetical protein